MVCTYVQDYGEMINYKILYYIAKATHKSEDYKITAVQYYLSKNNNQVQTCNIFKCHPRSLMRWVDKYSKNKNINGKTDYQKHTNLKKSRKIILEIKIKYFK
jgi:transposase-like protein